MTVSTSMFIPSRLPPFNGRHRDTVEQLQEKQDYLKEHRNRSIRYSWHDAEVSRWEAVLSRGDRRLGRVLLRGVRQGQRFDAWDEQFDYTVWSEAMQAEGLIPTFIPLDRATGRRRFPWSHIDVGVTDDFCGRSGRRHSRRSRHRNVACNVTPAAFRCFIAAFARPGTSGRLF